MVKTQNDLIIHDLTAEKVSVHGNRMIAFVGKLEATLVKTCSILGTIPQKIHFVAESYPVTNPNEGVRQAVENFLNGKSMIDVDVYYVDSESWCHNGINRIIVDFPEPLKSEFEKIFDSMNWQDVQLQIN